MRGVHVDPTIEPLLPCGSPLARMQKFRKMRRSSNPQISNENQRRLPAMK